jgi:hypothetical protein
MLTAKHRNDPASHLDALLDEALEETFPASDPIAISVAPEACRLEQSTAATRTVGYAASASLRRLEQFPL